MSLLSFVGRAENPAYSLDWGEVMSPRNGRRGAANQRKLFIAWDITTGIRRFARRWGSSSPIRGRSPLFCGNFPLFSGNEAAACLQERRPRCRQLSTPEKARPHPQRVPSGRHAHAYGASHPEGTSTSATRPIRKACPRLRRVPSGRRVLTYGASSARKRPTPRERSFARIYFNSLLPFSS